MEPRISRRQSGMPTITDVAARAGVSAMTVSRVINDETLVRPKTRERVLAAIAELNYAPNRAAQSLAGSSPIRIALLYSNPSSAYLSEFLVGGLDQASLGHVHLVVEKCEPGDHAREVAERLVAAGIEGLVLPPPLCDSDAVRAVIAEHGTPAVAVATGRVGDRLCVVSIDDREAARAMTRHIATLGHRRIGFIIGNPNQTASGLRLEGYRAGLAASGLFAADELVVQGDFTYRSGLAAAEALLHRRPPPTAIFASNDDMAAATVAVAHRRGLDVPGDLTVCGFDDTALATTIWPELTTIRQPITDMSRAAIDLLLEAVKRRRAGERPVPRSVRFDHSLVRRQSDAAPRSAAPRPAGVSPPGGRSG